MPMRHVLVLTLDENVGFSNVNGDDIVQLQFNQVSNHSIIAL